MAQHLEFNTFVNCVKNATQENNHTGALKFIAVYIARKHNRLPKVDKLFNAVEALETLHDYYGNLTPELAIIRQDLHNTAFTLLSIEEARAFHAAM